MEGIPGNDPEKNISTFHFYSILDSLGWQEYIAWKKEISMLGRAFFSLKFGTFWAFFNTGPVACQCQCHKIMRSLDFRNSQLSFVRLEFVLPSFLPDILPIHLTIGPLQFISLGTKSDNNTLFLPEPLPVDFSKPWLLSYDLYPFHTSNNFYSFLSRTTAKFPPTMQAFTFLQKSFCFLHVGH